MHLSQQPSSIIVYLCMATCALPLSAFAAAPGSACEFCNTNIANKNSDMTQSPKVLLGVNVPKSAQRYVPDLREFCLGSGIFPTGSCLALSSVARHALKLVTLISGWCTFAEPCSCPSQQHGASAFGLWRCHVQAFGNPLSSLRSCSTTMHALLGL